MASMKQRGTAFWEPGFSIFRSELAEEERERLAPLKDELKRTAGPARKGQLKQELAAIRAEFREKRKNARCSLFAKH